MIPTTSPIDALTTEDRDAMYQLLQRCFQGVTPEVFAADLEDKTLAIRLHDQAGQLQGFSTLALYLTTGAHGEPITVACSGDTIVAPEAWGSSALSRAWIGEALNWHAQYGVGDLYWLLITSGFRTYRFLPVFFKTFYPHHNTPSPAVTAAWMHQLASERWGKAYHRDEGVVRFAHPQRLRDDLAEVPSERLDDPHVATFLKLNPGHAAGDELVSLCRIAPDNLTRAGQRMVQGSIRSTTPVAGPTP
ncbi:MAG: hypothetical protein AAGA25_06785 [Planctomycetota bacterium]